MQLEDESFAVPDSYEDEPSQPQTQLNTQPQTQPTSQPVSHFPANLWGLLVSTSASPTAAELARREQENGGPSDEPYVERPARVEMAHGQPDCRVGRHPTADVVLNGKKISSWHARIFIDRKSVV